MASHDSEPVVLVVNDEAVVRDIARCVLETEGYRVVESPSAADALALIDAGEPIDLLLQVCMRNDAGGIDMVIVANGVAVGIAARHLTVLDDCSRRAGKAIAHAWSQGLRA